MFCAASSADLILLSMKATFRIAFSAAIASDAPPPESPRQWAGDFWKRCPECRGREDQWLDRTGTQGCFCSTSTESRPEGEVNERVPEFANGEPLTVVKAPVAGLNQRALT